MAKFVRTFAVLASLISLAIAHPGGLDAYGGHNDRKHGGYHFHRGPLAGESFSTKAAALEALSEAKTQKSESPPPTAERATPKKSESTQTVYVTRTGKKYHAAGCPYLRSSGRPMDLKEALASGYTACSRCNPPKAP